MNSVSPRPFWARSGHRARLGYLSASGNALDSFGNICHPATFGSADFRLNAQLATLSIYDFAMSEQFTGPHQCIGTARAVMDLMLRNLRARCAANGGNLSSGDIEKFYSDFVSSLSSGYEMFEVQHQCCMDASASAAEQPFKREAILATLLRACGEKSAFHAFSVQIKHCGSSWTHQFFADFARYINTRMRTNVDLRLIDAYVDISAIPKIKISVNELLRHESIQSVLRECLLPLEQAESINATTKQVCDFVNQHGANARDIGMAHISKITEDQVRSFLSLLSRESKLALKSPVLGLHAISV